MRTYHSESTKDLPNVKLKYIVYTYRKLEIMYFFIVVPALKKFVWKLLLLLSQLHYVQYRESVMVVRNFYVEFSAEIFVLIFQLSPWAQKVVRKICVCMLSLCGSRDSAKSTRPILFTFSINGYFRPEYNLKYKQIW